MFLKNRFKSEPIFILGVSRSGTTLLSGLIDAHSQVAIPYESHFFVDYERRFGNRDLLLRERYEVLENILAEPYVRRWDWCPSMAEVAVTRRKTLPAIISAVYETYAEHYGKCIWGDKSPSYIEHVEALYRMFPKARFIHVIRDGRDVALSLVNQWWGPNDFLGAMRSWAEQVRSARAALAKLPREQVLEIRLEDLAIEPEPMLQKVFAFLRLDFEPRILDTYRARVAARVGKRVQHHHAGLTQAISSDRVTRWPTKLCQADQALAWQIAGDLFTDLQYSPGVRRHPLCKWRKLVHRIIEAWHWRTGTVEQRYTTVFGVPMVHQDNR